MITSRQRQLWAGLLAGAAFAASAQAPLPATAEAPAAAREQSSAKPGGERHHRHDRARHIEHMKARQAQHLAELKDKLQLAPGQESAWQSFGSAMQPPAEPMQRMQRDEFKQLTTPQRLDLMEKRRAERAERFAGRTAATRAFYARLTPEQQKRFDDETLRMMAGGHRGHGGHHHGHHGHGAAEPEGSAAPRG